MTYYPVDPQPPCWALFDGTGVKIVWSDLNGSSITPEQCEAEAFRTINGNRNEPAVYIVKCLWTEPTLATAFYEVGERVYAPTGEEPDKTPPE
jgi:hypothetical protein